MRSNLPKIHGEGTRVHTAGLHIFRALLLTALTTATYTIAQSPQPSSTSSPAAKSVYAQVNEQAVLSRAGDAEATAQLTRQLFRNAAVPIELADLFGFTDRIVQAETAYRNGAHAPIHEADIVKAVNNLVGTIGAPTWANTSQAEVRKLRMHMLIAYPQLIANQGPPDANGNFKVLGENMRPVEASYVATSLLYQKIYNADYQFTAAERAQNAQLNPATVNANHLERTQLLQNLLQGGSGGISVRDLITASDHFFSDLGIEPAVSVGSVQPVQPVTTQPNAPVKGGL